MSPSILILLTSLAGAILFFVAGYILRAMRQASDSGVSGLLDQQLAEAQERAQKAAREADDARSEATAASEELQAAQAQARQAQGKLDAAAQARQQAEKGRDLATQQRRQADESILNLRNDNSGLEQRLEEQARVAKQLVKERSALQERLAEVEQQASHRGDEKSRLQAELDQLRGAQGKATLGGTELAAERRIRQKLEQGKGDLEQQLAGRMNRLEELQRELAAEQHLRFAREEELAQAREDVNSAKKQVNHLQLRMDKLLSGGGKRDTARLGVEHMQQENYRLRQERDELSEAAQELRAVNREHDQLKEEVSRIKAALAKAQEAQQQAATERERLDTQKKEMDRRLQRLRAQSDDQAVRLARADKHIIEIERQNAALTEEWNRAKQDADLLEKAQRQLAEQERALKEARLSLATAEARAAELEPVRQRAVELESELSRVGGAVSEAAKIERELKDARVQLSVMEQRTAELEEVRQALAELRSDHADAAAQVGELETVRGEAREARLQAQVMEQRAAELEELRQQNADLRQSLSELEDLRQTEARYVALQEEHRELRVRAELFDGRMEDLERVDQERSELQRQVNELSQAEQRAVTLEAKVKELEAQLFASGAKVSEKKREKKITGRLIDSLTAEIERGLNTLVGDGLAQSAVVADSQGLMVAGVGDGEPHEGMAALSGETEMLASQATDLLPMTEIRAVQLYDLNDLVLHCEVFAAGKEPLAVATLGPAPGPEHETVKQAVDTIAGAMDAHE